jgi:hypothetical protein
MQNFREDLAYITDKDGNKYQILNYDESDWDEEETRRVFNEAMEMAKQSEQIESKEGIFTRISKFFGG